LNEPFVAFIKRFFKFWWVFKNLHDVLGSGCGLDIHAEKLLQISSSPNRLLPKQLRNQVLRSRQGYLSWIPLTACANRKKLQAISKMQITFKDKA
jgi:hypothetical protein